MSPNNTTMEIQAAQQPGSLAAPSGSASFTYAEFEAAVKQCRWQCETAPAEPSCDYHEALENNPKAVALADESWRAGMDAMQTALLNWADDKIVLAGKTPEPGAIFNLAPGDVDGALAKVLEYIRIRQREIREIQDRFSQVTALESRDVMRCRHDEIDVVANVVSQLRWIANGRPNAQLTDRHD